MRTRLLCFAPAGASAGIFTSWRARMPASMELVAVELPGRGARSDEAPVGDMAALVQTLVTEVAPFGDSPLMVFGHSIGAKIGFELARALVARGARPRHLFVAASPADGFPSRGKGMHLLPREALVRELGALGTPEAVLGSERLLDMLLPSIRADLRLATEYEVLPGPRASFPITAFAGTRDPDIAVGDVAGWRRHTTGRFRLVQLEAGHNFVKERAAEVVDEIARTAEGASHVGQEDV